MKRRIDLDHAIASTMASLMQQLLVDAVALRLGIKQAHWTLRGPGFIAIHHLLDEIAGRVEEHVDELAERIVAIGHQPDGTVAGVAAGSRLAPYPAGITGQPAHLAAVADRLAAFGAAVRAAIDTAAGAGDQGTADLLTGLSRACDKDLWLIEAHEGG
jgi:starvation-inducible DNA-binding protein